MTKPMMDLKELVEKSADADLLREMIGFAAERLMELRIPKLRTGSYFPSFLEPRRATEKALSAVIK
mgnify:CR=1 FL=1